MQGFTLIGVWLLVTLLTLAGCQPSSTPTIPTNTQETQIQNETPAKTNPEKASINENISRKQFGSLISPDGEWLLAEKHIDKEETESAMISVHHILYAQNLKNGNEKILKELDEETNNLIGNEASPKDYPKYWTPAGWSADASKAYYAVSPYIDGLGGWYPNSNIHFEKIMEVDVDTGAIEEIFNPKSGFILSGVADFDGKTQLALAVNEESKTLTLTDLKTSKGQLIFDTTDTKKGDGISSAVFSPSLKKIAVATWTDPSGQKADGPVFRTYRLFIADLVTLETNEVKTFDAEWDFLNWIDENSINIFMHTPTGSSEEKISL